MDPRKRQTATATPAEPGVSLILLGFCVAYRPRRPSVAGT